MDSCVKTEVTVRILRNGLDPEPKKTYPPDYSNVPDVRTWNMSPFSKERFDLNEIQIAEKLGYKHKAEVERLKKLYGMGPPEEPPPKKKKETDSCKVCAARKAQAKYTYQPYGPSIVSAASFRPDAPFPSVYGFMGPSVLADFVASRSRRNTCSHPPRQSHAGEYIPYGPPVGPVTPCLMFEREKN